MGAINIDYSFTNAHWLRKDPNPAGYKEDKAKNEGVEDMPYANEHAAPVKSPDAFKTGKDDWASKDITEGVRIIMGKLKNPPQNAKPDSMVTQTYRFDASKFTPEAARKWLKENKVKYIKFEAAKESKDEARGEGQGVGGQRQGDGGADVCIGPKGEIKPHKKGMSCVEQYGKGWKGGKRESKNELEAKESLIDLNESSPMNETALVSFMLEKKEDAEDLMENYTGRVTVAQKAISENGNKREYPIQVLREAVENIKARMQKDGPLLMEIQHPRDGNNATDLEKVAALIHEVDWNDDGTVTLNDIQFVDTPPGRLMFNLSTKLQKAGAKLGVSQRALGKSHYVKNESGKVKEVVDQLYIKKWDFTAPGEQSVKQAQFELQRLTEEQEMADKKVLTEDEVNALMEAQETKFNETIEALKTEMEAKAKEKDTPAPPPEAPPATPPPAPPAENKDLLEMQGKLNAQNEKLERLTRKEELEELKETGTRLMNEELAKEDYKRFTEDEKKALLESVKFDEIHGKVDMSKAESITAAILESLQGEISTLDKLIAAARLRETGYGQRAGTGNGLTRVEVINENIPGMEFINQFGAEVNKWMDQENDWKLPEDHSARGTLKKILESYDQANYKRLLNEAAEDVTVSDIGIKNASVSRAFIAAVWPRLTALEVCETGTMNLIQDVIPVESFLPAFSTDVHTDVTLLQPAESAALNVAGITLGNYPILATPKNQSMMITSLARATAKGLAVEPVARSMAGLANYVRTIMDRMLWELIIAKAQAYAATGVTDWEVCTRVGTTNEHYSAHEGWVKFEFVKALDGNDNPESAKLVPLFGTTTGNSYQAVTARESQGDNTALVYGTHYTINWPDGTLTLTDAGASECAADLVEVKYTYTTNLKTWSIVPDSGVTLYNHLLNLAQMVGQAKVLVRNRYYEPNYVAMNIANEDLIGKGPQFTTSGYTAGNVKDALAMVTTYDGKPVKQSTAIPQGWIIVGKIGAAVYYVHTPWSIEGPLAIDNTRDRYWQVEEYSATDVPVTAKFALVGVTDLNT